MSMSMSWKNAERALVNMLPYSSVVTSSRILVHLPALRSHPGSFLSRR